MRKMEILRYGELERIRGDIKDMRREEGYWKIGGIRGDARIRGDNSVKKNSRKLF